MVNSATSSATIEHLRSIGVSEEKLQGFTGNSDFTLFVSLPDSTTTVSPAELLLGRRPRSHLDFIRPHLEQQVQDKQLTQQANRGGREAKEFADGSLVFDLEQYPDLVVLDPILSYWQMAVAFEDM